MRYSWGLIRQPYLLPCSSYPFHIKWVTAHQEQEIREMINNTADMYGELQVVTGRSLA